VLRQFLGVVTTGRRARTRDRTRAAAQPADVRYRDASRARATSTAAGPQPGDVPVLRVVAVLVPFQSWMLPGLTVSGGGMTM